MNESQYTNALQDEPIDFKLMFVKYLNFWPWFLLTVMIMLSSAYFYLRYTETVYSSEAKIKILDAQENNGLSFDVTSIFKRSNVVLENEIALLSSYHLMEDVVESLDLNVHYFQTGKINTREVFNSPIRVAHNGSKDSLSRTLSFEIKITSNGYEITNTDTNETISTTSFWFEGSSKGFPISVSPRQGTQLDNLPTGVFNVAITTINQSTSQLRKNVSVLPDGKESDLLILSLKNTNGPRAQSILNTLISVYEADGIKDRQEVSKRTIEFVNERFEYLIKDLDSIEKNKKDYKKNNNISFFEADAGVSLQTKSIKDEALFTIETQLLLSNILKKTLSNSDEFQLLPANIGITSTTINLLIEEYNTGVLEHEKLKTSAGANNPTVRLLDANILDLKNNISSSINGYIQQLQTTLTQSTAAFKKANRNFALLPEKENALRKIERNQNLKENLYLLLLEKREEAAVSYAVIVSNVKVIDYGITNPIPVAPKRQVIYLGALVLGLLLPFGVVYLLLTLDTKVRNKEDLLKGIKELPLLAEIPYIEDAKLFLNSNENSFFTESFRILTTGIDFVLPKKEKGAQVIFFTSSIKGEGKSYTAVNTSLAYASVGKKVLLVGCDLRNPQVHSYFNLNKNQKGLSNYLNDSTIKAVDCVLENDLKNKRPVDIVLSGQIPPNATGLLKNGRFETFLEELSPLYDNIIIDTAPILLVTDTVTIAKYCDLLVYLAKAGHTDKNLLQVPVELVKDQKVANIGIILNAVGKNASYGYGYGYGYGYNYGYGYGYKEQQKKQKWYQFKSNP